MSTENLKIELISKITQLQNSDVIKDINRLIDFELGEGIFKTNSLQKDRISEAKVEIKNKRKQCES